MTLPTQDEIEKMNGRELQTIALDFESVYNEEINRSTPKEELRTVLLNLLSSEPPVVESEEEIESKQEDVEESVNEEPENEQNEEDESAADIAEDVVDEVEGEIEESESEEESEDEETDNEDSPTLYRTNRRHTDWESGWSFDPNDVSNNTPKPIENMTDGLKHAIETGIIYAVE